jgi:hypothetical protein
MTCRTALALALALAACVPFVVLAQAAGADVFASTDAEGADAVRTGVFVDFRHADDLHYRGIRIEHADFSPATGPRFAADRLYYRFADTGTRWTWNGELGTDGDTWLGNATIHTGEARRQEYFIERGIVETAQGLERGLYSTLVGAAYDLPLDERSVLTGVAGVQEFTGANRRLHLRARYSRLLVEDWGVSAQLRTRYFANSEPREFDYYSPRWFAEAIPTLQVRRFRGGWMYQAAAGWGRQRDSESGWRSARLFEASVTSPSRGPWSLKASMGYSDTPSATGGYDYTYFSLAASRRF